jgi:hypothetical protein
MDFAGTAFLPWVAPEGREHAEDIFLPDETLMEEVMSFRAKYTTVAHNKITDVLFSCILFAINFVVEFV